MVANAPPAAMPTSGDPHPDPKQAADLLEGLEALREELGSVADEIIELLRRAGVTPPEDPTAH